MTLPLRGSDPPQKAVVDEFLEQVGLSGKLYSLPVRALRWPAAAGRDRPGARHPAPQPMFGDEPTGALDTRTAAEVLSLLWQSVDVAGQTVVR
ncbi:ABC transporter ATP-binding protein OS=Streptomyces tendae OX=1932 GN=F3L20_28815 PE=3 SV=1 [Streptomyces tendae]